ncbi:MAG: hypothetical protein ABIJ46_03760 [bacterium]
MYAQVIPSVRLPKNLGSYDYAVPERYRGLVRRGSWVIVPWRGRPTGGLVVGTSETPSVDAKRVVELLGFGDLHPLADDLLALPDLMAERYLTSPATALQAFLPRTPKTKVITEPADPETDRPPRPTVPQPDRLLIRYSSPEEKLAETVRLVRRTASAGMSAVVVTPHSSEVPWLAAALFSDDGPPVVELHGGLSAAKLRSTWRRLLAEPQAVVVGTRLAALAPANSPGLFLALESDSPDLRQYDQNPRYDARDVLAWRADRANAGLAFLSHAPRLEEYSAAAQGRLTRIATSDRNPESVLIDVAGNPRGERYPLSPTAMDRLAESLRQGKKVLVYHNRLGTAGALVCGDCRHVFRCGRCLIALGVHGRELRCLRCSASLPQPLNCPQCGGSGLRQVGLGTKSLGEALQRELPDCRVMAYDSDLPADRREAAVASADVLIATRLLLHDLAELPSTARWGCVVVSDLDGLLSFPGFRVTEEAWRTVRTLKDVAASSSATLCLQTCDPDSPKIKRLLQDEDGFVGPELEERRTFSYPPFGTLLTVTVRDPDRTRAETLATELRDAVRQALGPSDGSVAGPMPHRRPFRDGSWRSMIVIKTGERLPPPLQRLLGGLPDSHIVDRNPETAG